MNGRQVNTSVVILTVSLSFCLLILCRHMSQDEIRVHGKPSLDVSTMVKSGTLPRRHQMVECFARKGDETTFVNIERLPVLAMQQLSPASATYSSVVDAFVIRQPPRIAPRLLRHRRLRFARRARHGRAALRRAPRSRRYAGACTDRRRLPRARASAPRRREYRKIACGMM